jgi:RNA polymerase sigma factor (sigma-70 family)
MPDRRPETLSDAQLLRCCADNLSHESLWEEFVNRFGPVLARSTARAYRRFTRGAYPPTWRVSELVQEVYLRVLKDDCELLRRFRGETERTARAYLSQIAVNTTGDELRHESARKRQADLDSLEESHLVEEARQREEEFALTEGLVERELVKLLARGSTAENLQRDVLIFLLHFRLGLTAQEIARTDYFKLQPASVMSILIRTRTRLKKAVERAA